MRMLTAGEIRAAASGVLAGAAAIAICDNKMQQVPRLRTHFVDAGRACGFNFADTVIIDNIQGASDAADIGMARHDLKANTFGCERLYVVNAHICGERVNRG